MEKGATPDRIVVIPNWVDTTAIVPQPRENEWTRAHGLVDRFVVMHSGNVGHSQNLDVLIRATTFLRDLDDLAVVIVGGGARRGELIELADRLETDAVRFSATSRARRSPRRCPLRTSTTSASAAACPGYVVPSRLYGILVGGPPCARRRGRGERDGGGRPLGRAAG